jgi:hypothetical protein
MAIGGPMDPPPPPPPKFIVPPSTGRRRSANGATANWQPTQPTVVEHGTRPTYPASKRKADSWR